MGGYTTMNINVWLKQQIGDLYSHAMAGHEHWGHADMKTGQYHQEWGIFWEYLWERVNQYILIKVISDLEIKHPPEPVLSVFILR